MPDAKLEAFKFVIFVPGPKKPNDVKIPETVTPEPNVIKVPVSVMLELPSVSSSRNLVTLFDIPPFAVRIPVTLTDVQTIALPVEIKIWLAVPELKFESYN